jgi:hypothetical protein
MYLMKKPVLLFIVVLTATILNAQDTSKTKFRAWWNESNPPPPKQSPQAKQLPLIHVYKNKFVNAKGDTILFRGLSISDP